MDWQPSSRLARLSEAKKKAETKRQEAALLRDVAIRFLKSVSWLMTEKFTKSAGSKTSITDAEVRETIQQLVTRTDDEIDVDKIPGKAWPLVGEAIRNAAPKIPELDTLLAEMRLMLPKLAFRKAKKVAITVIQCLLSSGVHDLEITCRAEHNAAVYDFVDALRRYLDLDGLDSQN